MNAPTDYQLAVCDGLLRSEETGVPYPWMSVPRPTRAALRRTGLVDEHPNNAINRERGLFTLTDTGRALVIGWRLGQKKRRRCA